MENYHYVIAALIVLLLIIIVISPSEEVSEEVSSNTQTSGAVVSSEQNASTPAIPSVHATPPSTPVQNSETGQNVQTIPASSSVQTPAPTESSISAVLKTYFNINPSASRTKTTRYILIEKAFMFPQTGSTTELFEVEVYNGATKIRPTSITAGSERADGGNLIRRSIDGYTGTMGQTNWSRNLNDLWVKIDLGREYEVSHIKLFTRKDCCRDRLIGIRVKFFNEANVETFKSRAFQYLEEVNKDEITVSITDPYEISKNNVLNGRFILLERTSNSGFGNQLSVREIRVFDADNNIIVPKAIDAGSQIPDGRNPASRAIDGNLTNVAQTNWTNNITDHWFKLDLGADREIKAVYVYNRTDCCRNRMLNTRLRIIDESGEDRYISATLTDTSSVDVDIMKFEI